MQFLIALAVVVGGWWLIRKAARMPPQASRNLAQKLGGGAIIAVSGLLALRGQMQIAIPMFLFGAGMIGKTSAFPNGFSWAARRQARRAVSPRRSSPWNLITTAGRWTAKCCRVRPRARGCRNW